MLDLVSHAREEWESEATVRAAGAQTCTTADTHALIAAVGLGKNLKAVPVPPPSQQGATSKASQGKRLCSNLEA